MQAVPPEGAMRAGISMAKYVIITELHLRLMVSHSKFSVCTGVLIVRYCKMGRKLPNRDVLARSFDSAPVLS
jgi:hypothetical protein